MYRLCRLFGWTVDEALDAPAGLSDMFLAFADVERSARPPDEE